MYLYRRHYHDLDEILWCPPNDIYAEAFDNLPVHICQKASSIYNKMNPELLPSPFLSSGDNLDLITRFRLGSRRLPN